MFSHLNWKKMCSSQIAMLFLCVVVVLLFNIHGKQLRSCGDGQLI